MKSFTVSAAVALLAALAQATPTPENCQVEMFAPPGLEATLIFQAADVTKTILEPATETHFTVPLDHLNIDKVTLYNPTPPKITCTLTGQNGSKYGLYPMATATIGPPQPIIGGNCHSN